MSKFDKKEYLNSGASPQFKEFVGGVEVAAIYTADYTNAAGRTSKMRFAILSVSGDHNIAQKTLVEKIKVSVRKHEYTDSGPEKKYGGRDDASVDTTLRVDRMTNIEDTRVGLDIDKTLGELLYPQQDWMLVKNWGILSVDKLLASEGQEYIEKLRASPRWGSEPQFLTQPERIYREEVTYTR